MRLGLRTTLAIALGLLVMPVSAAMAVAPAAAPMLRIVDTATFVPANGTFTFEVDTSELRLTDELAWTVHSLVPNDSESIELALGDEPGPPLRAEQRATIAELGLLAGEEARPSGPASSTTTVSIPVRSVSTGDDRVYLPDAGIYPVSLRLLRDGDPLDALTLPLIRLHQKPGDHPRLVHLVRTVPGGPALSLDGTAEPTADDVTRLTDLAEQLAELPSRGDRPSVSVSLPAELLDTLARSEAPGDASVVDQLAEVADRATWLATPYVPLKLGEWAAADVARNPALTLSYDTSRRRLAGLLDVEVDNTLVPPDPTLAKPAVGFLADRGATTVLLEPKTEGLEAGTAVTSVEGTTVADDGRPERTTERPADAEAPTTSVSLPALRVSDFSSSAETDRLIDAAGVARELALLSAEPLAEHEDPDSAEATDGDAEAGPFDAVVLRVPDSLDEGQLAVLLRSLDAADGVLAPTDATGLRRQIDQRAGGASRRSGRPTKQSLVLPNATSSQLGPLELSTYRGQQAINAASDLDPDNEAVAVAQRQLLTSPHRGLSLEEAQAYALSARGGAQAVLDSVTLGDLSAITLAARRSKVPFRFRNELETSVTVSLRIRSERLRLTDAADDGSVKLELPPGASTSEVSVEVVTSGAFNVTAEVLTPTGDEVIQREKFQVRSRAFSGVGVALSVASLAVLALWWFRTARAKRRDE